MATEHLRLWKNVARLYICNAKILTDFFIVKRSTNTQVCLCLVFLHETQNCLKIMQVQPAERLLTQRICNIRTHTNSALKEDAKN